MNVHQHLFEGCAALNLDISEDKASLLLTFIDLIAKWNKAYNLTAIKTKQEMVELHLLDSLTVLPYLHGDHIIDIGTGAGLPGIPMAICLPEKKFTLLDSNAKKTRFVQQAVLELRLTNVEVVNYRVEEYRPEQLFDTVITRAFAELSDIIKLTRHLSAENGIILAMKGQNANAEMAKIDQSATVIPVTIPGNEVTRNLVLLRP